MDGLIAYALSKKYADEVGQSILEAGFKTQVEQDRSILQTVGQEKILYFIPKTTAKPSDGYDEYVYSNNAWEQVGVTDVDLSFYATKAEVGNLNNLPTTDKSSIVSAISETFTSVSNGKSLVASAITDKGVSTSSDATFEIMAQNIEAIPTGSPTVLNPALVLWDWEGTKLAEYSREDALALTELPNPNTLAPYVEAAHVFLTFYEWNWDLTDAQDWIRKHKNVPRDIGAIFLTTDGETHDEWTNSRPNSNYIIKSQKRASAESLSNVMQDCTVLKYYSLPPNIKHLYGTFYNCFSLQHLNVPKSIESLRTNVFHSNQSLRKIILPKKYINMWTDVFYGCTALDEIELFNTINLNSDVFNNCRSLTKIHLPSTLQNIYEKVFLNCISLCDILNESKAVLTNVNAFEGLPSNYYIYVPRADLSWFETETNWSTIYAQGHIVAIEDYIDYLESIGFDVDAYKEATP